MRRFLFPLLCAAGLLSAGVVSAAEWRVALGVYDQVNSQKNQVGGGLAGFNEALAREICRRAAARCAFSSLEFKTILDGVAQGDYQLGFGNFLRTPEREQRVGFSAPVWRSSSRLIGTPAAAKRFAPDAGGEVQLDRLAGARVITISGTAQYRYLQSHAAARGLSIVEMSVLQDAPARLLAGEADFLLVPALSGYALIANLPDGKLQFVGPAVAEHGLGGTVHIALPKGDTSIQKAVDQAIAAIRADGTYQRIVRQFFPFSLD